MTRNDLITLVREYKRIEMRTGQSMKEPITLIVDAYENTTVVGIPTEDGRNAEVQAVEDFLSNEYPAALKPPRKYPDEIPF